MSKAAALVAPRFCCTIQAVDGKGKSGVTVPQMMRSSSAGSTSAISNARRAARVAKVEVNSPSAAIRRSLIPVRLVIQSVLVSTIRSRS